MGRQWTYIDDLVNDYMLQMDDDDFGATRNFTKIRNIAIAAMKELRRSGAKTMKSYVISVDESTNSIELPEDFIDYCRVGIVNTAGEFIPMAKNPVLGKMYQQPLLDNTNAKLLDADGIELTALRQYSGSSNNAPNEEEMIVYYTRFGTGADFGVSGGSSMGGEYRIDIENNRMYFSTSMTESEVILEYIADESMSSNPRVHEYCEQAVMDYIYWHLINRKINVPLGEKMRARKTYANSKELAITNMSQDKSVAEILIRLDKHTQLAPRTSGRIYR